MYVLLIIAQTMIGGPEQILYTSFDLPKTLDNALLSENKEIRCQFTGDHVNIIYEGATINKILLETQFSTNSISDSIQTIWLPDTQGGVVNPAVFECNPLHDVMYVMGREQQNIAVCDRQTGERLGGICTDRGTMGITYSRTSNKVYCASYANNDIEVFDAANYAKIKTINIPDYPHGIVWNSATNEVYCSYETYPYISVVDCDNDSLILNIPVTGGSHPWSILFSPLSNKIYCPCGDSINIIDGTSHTVLATVPAGGQTRFSTINTIQNKIYYASNFNNIVSIINGHTDSLITTLAVGLEPYCIEYNSVMNLVYVGHRSGKKIYLIDGTSNSIIDILDFGVEILSMAYDSLDNRLFCSGAWEDIMVIDCSTNVIIDSLDTDDFTEGLYWDAGYNRIWVGNSCYSNYPTYTIFGYAADSLTRLFRTPAGFTPYKACLHSPTNKLFSVGIKDLFISILDIDEPAHGAMKEIGRFPFDIVQNTENDKIYCANRYADSIIVLDAFTDSILAQVPTGQEPVRLAYNQTDNKIYCANLTGNSVTVIDGTTNYVVNTVPVGDRPISVLWNSIDNKIYVGNSTDCTVTIIDASVDTVITTVPSGCHQWTMCHDVIDDKIYCANWHSDNITVIDGVTDSVVKNLYIGKPHCLAYNSSANRMYCGSVQYGAIYVIACDSDSFINTIPVGDGISALLYNPLSNTLFCVYCSRDAYPWRDALAVIDCNTDSIIEHYISEAQRWSYGLADPKDALVLDSLNNLVYFTHYTASKISVLDGATGVMENTRTSDHPLLHQVIPNPARYMFMVEINTPTSSDLSIKIYDVAGRLKDKIFDGLSREGINRFTVQGDKFTSGIYFVKVETGTCTETQKVIFLK